MSPTADKPDLAARQLPAGAAMPPRAGWATSPASPAAQRAAYCVVVLGLALAAWVYAQKLGAPSFPVDDAYISLHNAQVFAGTDPRFPGVPALSGSTSLVHVALVALFVRVLAPLWALWLVNVLGAMAYAAGLLRLAFLAGGSLLEAGLLVALGLVVAEVPHQLMNGLETGLAMAAVAWALGAAGADGPRRWELPVACGTLPFVRPELGALGLGLFVLRLRADLTRGRPSLVRSCAQLVAAAAPWLVLALISFGAPLPNTVSAKAYFFAEGCLPFEMRSTWILASLHLFETTLGYFVLSGLGLLVTTAGRVGLVFAGVFVGAYLVRFPGALGHYELRYLYVFVPLLAYGACAAIGSGSRQLRKAYLALGLVALVQSALLAGERFAAHRARRDFTRRELHAVASWLDSHAVGQRVLLHDIGYVSFATRAELVDLVGLKQRSAMLVHRDLTYAHCGGEARGDAVARIAAEEHPRFAVLLTRWDAIYHMADGLRRHGWTLTPVFKGEAYSIYALEPPTRS
jgi:hypothetical protein